MGTVQNSKGYSYQKICKAKTKDQWFDENSASRTNKISNQLGLALLF